MIKFEKKKSIIVLGIIIFLSILVIIIILSVKNSSQSNHESLNFDYDDMGKYAYNNPIVPEGFRKIETSTASWNLENDIPIGWNNGLVIEDEIGNQFVWIPVDVNNLSYPEYRVGWDRFYLYNSENLDETIKKYGGFYIARYEAGVPEKLQSIDNNISAETNNVEGVPVSKKDAKVWNFISYDNAERNARKMYSDENIQSELISLNQSVWILKWLNESGYDTYSDSSLWGNYSNNIFTFTGKYSGDYGKNYLYGENMSKTYRNIITSTGICETNVANNIYDLAGNVWDATQTAFEDNNNFHYCFGGHYDTAGSLHTASARYAYYSEPSDRIGFRIVLDIK